MNLRFLIDAQLPPQLATQLRALGHEAKHVSAVGMGEAADRKIWQYAARQSYILISKDEDFANLSYLDSTGPQMIWIRLGNTTNRRLWSRLAPIFPDLERRLENGDRIVEVVPRF